MDTIKRTIQKRIVDYLQPQKVSLILGARRVGKTILLRQLLKSWQGQSMVLNGEDYDSQALLEPCSVANYRRLLEGVGLLAIDEAQNIPKIGQKLKLMVDEIPHIRIIVTGSSPFELLNQTKEPLVGRSAKFCLHAFSQRELASQENALETRQNLESRLLYGSYPEVVLMSGAKRKAEYLRELVNSFLLMDILSIDSVKNFAKMRELLRLIASRTGEELSYDELGRALGMSKNTVEKYLDLLTKIFLLHRLGAYARNHPKEVTKTGRWYFYDNGIRNALIGNFNPPNLRQDMPLLWKSYIIGERIKNRDNTGGTEEFYFWRTYDGQEIDLIADFSIEGDTPFLAAFDCEWEKGPLALKESRAPAAFAAAYPGAPYQAINRENYLERIEPLP